MLHLMQQLHLKLELVLLYERPSSSYSTFPAIVLPRNANRLASAFYILHCASTLQLGSKNVQVQLIGKMLHGQFIVLQLHSYNLSAAWQYWALMLIHCQMPGISN